MRILLFGSLLPSFLDAFLHGINWFGMETDHECLGGLWKHSIDFYLQGLHQQGWNAIRVPLCAQSILENPILSPDLLQGDSELVSQDIRYLDLLDRLFQKTNSHSIHILLDIHRLKPAFTTPLWYIPNDPFWTYYRVWDVYDLLLFRYHSLPHFLGLDLFNEPHYMASFGDNNVSTDWRLFSQESIHYLFQAHSIVNTSLTLTISGIDWGKNLSLLSTYPYTFPSEFQNHIMFSPHLYGPSLNYIPSYEKSSLYQYWDLLFGNVTSPSQLWIGEWGGRFMDPLDHLWLSIFWQYCAEKNISGHFFWALNPDSKDVDGLLNPSWDTWNEPVRSFFSLV